MKDLLCDQFQNTVSEMLLCHRSILEILAKLQESGARVQRSVVHSVTSCGCQKIMADKRPLPENATLVDLKNLLDSHLSGSLCDDCRDIIENEIGRSLFYLAALCNLLDLNLYDIFLKEHKQLQILREYNMV
ncbi:hypothetical protein [Desulforamulus hydrothermalis]|uniref:DUF1573 domain-containing protein n=1 Tax=Desulforamulus hydrothermalis Lam5 = DSM 18033 TaxID=1121428 RepID=K8DYE6_9FIRM|nr:hypothetical protein [Desulforamulus hydrothermalis]CCO07765.1 conserved hypothetical protein [Desulforamulus hydrothermalis Lam5 = DSM 18033]SHH39831.1 hypothetical protein SAMN02745177_02419 [Desulforamulus hydrothermalis Lam5 = DSM 18033]